MSEPPARQDPLGVVNDALTRAGEAMTLASRHLDPSLVDVLGILGFDRSYVSAKGSLLHDADGRDYLDMHTGEGFASLGHNHPDVRAVLQATLAADLVDGVQIHYSALAGILADELTRHLPSSLDAVFFSSAGAEAVDTAMKFARAATGRPRLLSCDSSFHGVTLGPLSMVGDEFFKEGFGPLLPDCQRVPFGDLDRLEAALRRHDVAAFFVEPIQGRMVTLPPPGYLRAAQDLCRRHGTLFVLDEIQTGLGRTGRWFALEHEAGAKPEAGLEPDFVLVGKALSGGYMPVAATVTTREIYQRAVGTLERSYVHQSTYGRNRLSMAAGLAAIRIIERDGLVEHSARIGSLLRDGLSELQRRYEMLGDIRGRGLMIGIELQAPNARWARMNWRLIHLASGGLFPQLLVIPLHRDHRVITMAAGKNDVIKLLPPLTLSEAEAERFLEAFDAVLADCHGAAGRNWSVVRDIATETLRRRVGGAAPARGDDGPARGDDGPAQTAATAPGQAARPATRGAPVDPSQDNVCLVTGATGFIGGRLVQRLVEDGYQVRCTVRASSDTARLERLGVELVLGDLADADSLRAAATGCRYAVHCGALVSDWATTAEIRRTNVTGTHNLLDACAAASVDRLIHMSTTDVYGYPGGAGIDETQRPTRFANWYSATKLEAEHEVLAAAGRGGPEIVILRPATVYGPGSVDVVGEIASALRGHHMLLIDGGRAVAGLCYIDNLIDAAMLALTDERAAGEAFNITDGLDVSWRRFVDDLAAGLGCAPPRWSVPYGAAHAIGLSLESGYRVLRTATHLHTPPLLSRQAVDVLGRNQDFSNAKARRLLGWEPRVGYAAGLQATLAWLRSEQRPG